MPQGVSIAQTPDWPGEGLPHGGRPLAGALTGALISLVLGVAADAGIWLWAFGQALSGRTGINVPFVVTTDVERGDVVASSGIGVFLIPVALAAVGVVIGWFVGRRKRVDSNVHTAAGR